LHVDAAKRALVKLGEELSRTSDSTDALIAKAEEQLSAIRSTRGAAPPSESLTLLRGSDVKMERTDWLWSHWLAAGCLQVFAGPAGLGKTTIALSLAATVTRGRLWPDGSRCTSPGSVIFWSGEDAVDKTLMPRFTAMGGDPQNIYFVDAVTVRSDGRLETREFDPSKDIPLLIAKANELGDVRLLVVDPVSMCVAGDSNKNAEVRRGLAPLKVFAERHGAAVLGISHFSKGSEGRDPLSRVTGSLAFGAAPRLVLSAVTEARKPDEPEDAEPRHLFVRTKSNLGPCGDGFRYSVEQVVVGGAIDTSRIVWGEHLKGDARELLAEAEQVEEPDEVTAKGDAGHFLAEILAGGPVESKAVFAEARQAGHSQRTLERAKAALRVEAVRDGSSRPPRWLWRLPPQVRQPESQDRQSQNGGGLGGLGGLNGNSGTCASEVRHPESKTANAANSASPQASGGVGDDLEAF
jgi:putative DNA primase/helicase